ncbi:MAG: tetratricopeptide repeat protein, partial [Bryobacteraceae bacterium]
VLLQAGQFDAAAVPLDRALKLLPPEPDTAYPHYLRAKAYTGQNSVEKAAAQLMAAVSLRPDFAEAWSDLGQARKTLLDRAGALAAFERAATLSPEDPVVQTRLGSEYFDQGKIPPAVEHLRDAVRLDPTNQTALYKLQLALRENGRLDEAGAIKRRLSELLLDNDKRAQRALSAIQINNRGSALEKTGDLRGALEKYRAALRLDPAHVGIRVNLGVVLLRLGQTTEGMAELREALRRDPGNTAARAALEEARKRTPAQ